MLDLVKPSIPHQVTLRDIKRCKLAPQFFDTFFNLERWLEHEQKDPFQSSRVSPTDIGKNKTEKVWGVLVKRLKKDVINILLLSCDMRHFSIILITKERL